MAQKVLFGVGFATIFGAAPIAIMTKCEQKRIENAKKCEKEALCLKETSDEDK